MSMGTHCRHILGKPNWAPAGHAQLGPCWVMVGMPSWAPAGHAHLLPIVGKCWACPAGPRLGKPSSGHVGACWACPAGPQPVVPTYCQLWAYAGHAQHGPSWACPLTAHCGHMLGMPSWAPAGLAQHMPTMGSKWARPGTPIMAQAGALLGIVGPSFAQHGPTWACCRG